MWDIRNKLGLSWAKLKLSFKLQMKLLLKLGVVIVVEVGVQLLFRGGGWMGGWVVGENESNT